MPFSMHLTVGVAQQDLLQKDGALVMVLRCATACANPLSAWGHAGAMLARVAIKTLGRKPSPAAVDPVLTLALVETLMRTAGQVCLGFLKCISPLSPDHELGFSVLLQRNPYMPHTEAKLAL